MVSFQILVLLVVVLILVINLVIGYVNQETDYSEPSDKPISQVLATDYVTEDLEGH